MPQGYQCDKCEEFVEKHGEETLEHGPSEEIPLVFDTELRRVRKTVTLCTGCREDLEEWVEDGDVTHTFEAASFPWIKDDDSSSFTAGYNAVGRKTSKDVVDEIDELLAGYYPDEHSRVGE